MLPKWHVLINLVLSLILLIFINPVYTLIFFLSSVLIDLDHYLYYIYEKKDFSLKKAYSWHKLTRERFHNLSKEEKKKHKYFVLIFHGFEILVIMLALSKVYPVLFFVFLGFFVHLTEDSIIATKFNYLERKLFLTYAIYLHQKNKVK
jgi:acyl-coenzyme A synthetase/AMP-(fatty) acid ligase